MAKNLVMVFGVVLTLVGILGFFNHPVLGIFGVNTLHNIIHLASGLVAIALAMRGEAGAITFAKVFGVIYALVAILGLVASSVTASLLNTNGADHALHVVLAVVFLLIGFGARSNASNNMTSGMNS